MINLSKFMSLGTWTKELAKQLA